MNKFLAKLVEKADPSSLLMMMVLSGIFGYEEFTENDQDVVKHDIYAIHLDDFDELSQVQYDQLQAIIANQTMLTSKMNLLTFRVQQLDGVNFDIED